MKIFYLVHDLNDAAVHKRVRMFHAGGAQVTVAGFYRGSAAPAEIDGAPVMILAKTFDFQLVHRARSVLAAVAQAGRLRAHAHDADVIVARNLECLAIAVRVRAACAPRAALVYECLDIHRALLGSRWPGRLLRGLERRLMAGAGLVIVSSPAFARDYFSKRQGRNRGVLLVENKVIDLAEPPGPRPALPRPEGPPWRIGWFGMIRCRRSLEILGRLAAEADGDVEVIIRGRPSPAEFEDFAGAVAAMPHVRFEGAYKPEDLAAHYGDIHFAWAIDYFEEGLNSTWLLPNRLYEGGFFGAVPIAQSTVETGAWLARRDVGILLDDPETQLAGALSALTPQSYDVQHQRVMALPIVDLRAERQDCIDLVRQLEGLPRGR